VQVKVDRTRTREEEVYDIVRDAGENTNFLCTPKGSSNLFCAFVNVCICMCCVCIHKHTHTFDRTNLNNSALDNRQFRLHGTADHRVLRASACLRRFESKIFTKHRNAVAKLLESCATSHHSSLVHLNNSACDTRRLLLGPRSPQPMPEAECVSTQHNSSSIHVRLRPRARFPGRASQRRLLRQDALPARPRRHQLRLFGAFALSASRRFMQILRFLAPCPSFYAPVQILSILSGL
jgi:hypothetical protein